MYRKLFFLVSFVLVLALVSNASAASVTWTNDDPGDSLWRTGNNWSLGVPPTSAQTVYLGSSLIGPTIDSITTAVCKKLSGPGHSTPGIATMHIIGGSLTVASSYWTIGQHIVGHGTANVSAGATVTVDTDLYVGNNSNGTLNVSGSSTTIDVGDELKIANAATCDFGHVNLYSGTITCNDLLGNATNELLINIHEGTLIVKNKTGGPMQGWIDNGYIIGYGGRGEAVVDHNESTGWDTVTAISGLNIAWNPSPGNNEEAERYADLSWSSGDAAVFHEVYFGTSLSDVNSAADPNTLPGRGRQAGNSYEPGTLDFDTTYYWRIDEVNEAHGDSPWKGPVWRFTTPIWEAVDDFDSYADQAALRVVWHDSTNGGTNAVVDVNTDPNYVCDGSSMKFDYSNTADSNKYSEAWALTSTLGIGTDWTRDDLKALVVKFHGKGGNTAQPLYVVLEDSVPNVGVVTYDDADAIQKDRWHEWGIDLQDFSDSGVILTDVQKVYLGVGVRGETVVDGGTGSVYFDDVRLYLSRCLYKPTKASGNLNDDCIINLRDIAVPAGNWLKEGMWP